MARGVENCHLTYGFHHWKTVNGGMQYWCPVTGLHNFTTARAYNEQFQPELLRNLSPSIGPFHVSLNSQEQVVLQHIVFFRRFYTALFQKQLANKPRPWRITLLLELLCSAWTLIRQPILE